MLRDDTQKGKVPGESQLSCQLCRNCFFVTGSACSNPHPSPRCRAKVHDTRLKLAGAFNSYDCLTVATDKHGRAHDSVVERVTATIHVVKPGILGFRHAISHVDNREEQLAFGGHLLDSRRRFLTDPLVVPQ